MGGLKMRDKNPDLSLRVFAEVERMTPAERAAAWQKVSVGFRGTRHAIALAKALRMYQHRERIAAENAAAIRSA